MPFYEYLCKNCGHELEAMQKVSDSPLRKCPHCGRSQLQRLMSAPVFRLKGGGWYETDFKGEKDKQRNLERPEPEAPKDSKDAKDTKEAKTAEAKVPDAAPVKEAAAKDAAVKDKPADKPKEKASRSAAKPIAKKKPLKAKRRR
ncbi:MAG TPA: FmdB family zinc ribbon protein [Steroidobacteraceae bacterium]